MLFLYLAMLLEKLIEQHRVDLLVANGLWLTVPITDDQVGVYFFYFLSNESELRYACGSDLFL